LTCPGKTDIILDKRFITKKNQCEERWDKGQGTSSGK